MKKWRITIVINDIKGEHSAESLVDEIKLIWMPPSHNIELKELKVGLLGVEGADGGSQT